MENLELEITGTIPFKSVRVPFSDLGDARLVAVTGENGAGKTTLFECGPGVLYRTTPSRGLLSALCNTNNSTFRYVTKVGPHTIEARVKIDAVNGKTESHLLVDGDDKAPDGKVRTYQDAVAKYFPPQDVYLASAFGAQSGAGRFLDLDPADRRKMLARLIGAEKWQGLADAAGENARQAEKLLDEGKGRLESLRPTGREVTDEQITDARARVEDFEKTIAAEHARSEAVRAEHDAWKDALSRLEKKGFEIGIRDGNFQSAEDCAAVEADKIRREVVQLEKRLENETRLKLIAGGECEDPAEIETEIQRFLEAEKTRSEVAAEIRQAEIRKQNAVEKATKAYGDAQTKAALLDSVPCAGKFPSCQFLDDAAHARADLDRLADDLAKARAIQIPPLPPGKSPGHRIELQRRLPAIREKAKAIAEAKSELGLLAEVSASLAACEKRLQSETAKLDDAKAKKEEARAEFEAKEAEIEAHKKIEPARFDDANLTRLQTRGDEARSDLAAFAARRDVEKERARDFAEWKVRVDTLAQDLDDWTTLAKACGPRGVQAYEIDAAAPAISALCNDLLHACYGPRFSVRLSTVAAKASGGVKEVCDLVVLDSERGTDGSAALKSGGERVIIGEALSLAIAIYNTRRSEIPMADLVRDECAGALDGDNARRYVAMVRKALDLGGFHRAFFVSHVPELWELADARLHVEDGKVSVVGRAA
jgi:exonuclease SbcC